MIKILVIALLYLCVHAQDTTPMPEDGVSEEKDSILASIWANPWTICFILLAVMVALILTDYCLRKKLKAKRAKLREELKARKAEEKAQDPRRRDGERRPKRDRNIRERKERMMRERRNTRHRIPVPVADRSRGIVNERRESGAASPSKDRMVDQRSSQDNRRPIEPQEQRRDYQGSPAHSPGPRYGHFREDRVDDRRPSNNDQVPAPAYDRRSPQQSQQAAGTTEGQAPRDQGYNQRSPQKSGRAHGQIPGDPIYDQRSPTGQQMPRKQRSPGGYQEDRSRIPRPSRY